MNGTNKKPHKLNHHKNNSYKNYITKWDRFGHKPN